ITREIIERADYLVDIHAGDGNESLRPYTYWSPLGLNARADSIARQMALAWGNDYIVIDTARPHDLRASVYTQNTAHLRGKPALTTEAGYLGVPAEDMVTRNVQGVFRLLRYLKMLPGEVELVRHPLWFDRSEVLRSPGTGIWYPLVERGHAVQKGAVIGVVTDFFGDTTAVKVQNQNYLDMDVFVVRGGQRIRLGMVTGLSTHLFMLRPEVVGTGTDLQFEFHPIGGRANPRTERIMVQPGDVIELTIPPS